MLELIKNSWHNQCRLSALRGMHPFRHTQSKMLIPASKFPYCSISSTTTASPPPRYNCMAFWVVPITVTWIDGDLDDRANNGCTQMDILDVCTVSSSFIPAWTDFDQGLGALPLVLLSFQFASGVQFLEWSHVIYIRKCILVFNALYLRIFEKTVTFITVRTKGPQIERVERPSESYSTHLLLLDWWT